MNGYEFDAVLQDTLEMTAETTEYVIEIGARPSDHRIINPYKWSLVVVVSNTPLQPSLTDFIESLLGGSALASTVAGLTSSFLAGSNHARSSAALEFLVTLLISGEPIDIDGGDFQLYNMVVNRVRRMKDPSNENALVAEVELQEFPSLSTTLSKNGVSTDKLRDDDPSKTQAAATNDRGETGGRTYTGTSALLVNEAYG